MGAQNEIDQQTYQFVAGWECVHAFLSARGRSVSGRRCHHEHRKRMQHAVITKRPHTLGARGTFDHRVA